MADCGVVPLSQSPIDPLSCCQRMSDGDRGRFMTQPWLVCEKASCDQFSATRYDTPSRPRKDDENGLQMSEIAPLKFLSITASGKPTTLTPPMPSGSVIAS